MKYFIIAGEASGDLHASNLMAELRNADAEAEFCFLGGDLMLKQGGTLIRHYRQMAFMGVLNVLLHARTILGNLKATRNAIAGFKPDVLILVDYPSFNLNIAKWVKKKYPEIQVFYYISPKIWAWKEWRVHAIRKYVDKMFTIFPFETEFYAKYQYAVEYVGNPTVDSVSMRPNQDKTLEAFCAGNHLTDRPVIAVLAGSRKQEIAGCLTRMMDAALKFPDHQVVVAGAPGADPSLYAKIIGNRNVHVVFGATYELLQIADAAIVNSGTATLETALIGTPQVVVYHVPLGRLGYFVKEKLIRVKYVSLVNIVACRMVVKELLAHLFTVENIEAELQELLYNSDYRKKLIDGYNDISTELGQPGTAQRAARRMYQLLNSSVSK